MFEYKVSMSQDGSSLKEKPGSAPPVSGADMYASKRPPPSSATPGLGECLSIQEVFNASGSQIVNTEETTGSSYWISKAVSNNCHSTILTYCHPKHDHLLKGGTQ